MANDSDTDVRIWCLTKDFAGPKLASSASHPIGGWTLCPHRDSWRAPAPAPALGPI